MKNRPILLSTLLGKTLHCGYVLVPLIKSSTVRIFTFQKLRFVPSCLKIIDKSNFIYIKINILVYQYTTRIIDTSIRTKLGSWQKFYTLYKFDKLDTLLKTNFCMNGLKSLYQKENYKLMCFLKNAHDNTVLENTFKTIINAVETNYYRKLING